MGSDLARLLPALIDIAKSAAQAILPHHRTKAAQKQFTMKDDASPVTVADFAANDVIVSGLRRISDWPIISEESALADFATRQTWPRYWLVDPLDGTKEFIAGTNDFTVNIALIDDHLPVLSVIVVPITHVVYSACVGVGAQRVQPGQDPEPLQVRRWDGVRHLNIVASRRHDNKDVDRILISGVTCEIERMGSSIKFCKVAEGVADFYPRFGPTSEWDTAAGQCIVEQSGGKVTDADGNRLRYNTKESLLNPHFVVVGDYDNIQPLWRK